MMYTSRKARLEGSRRWHQGWAGLLLLSGARLGLSAPGDLDATFGSGGVVITDVAARESAAALVRQPDGTLVVAGTSYGQETTRVVLARYAPDGRLDVTFGKDGTVRTTFEPWTSVSALIRQPNGKLVVAGSSGDGMHAPNVFLARYAPDGRLDPTFGSGGFVLTDFGGGGEASEGAGALVLQPDGKLVVAGSVNSVPHSSSLILARYHPDGRLDATFGAEGRVRTSIPGYATALIRQPDGKLVVAGGVGHSRMSFGVVLVARFLPDGRLDATFGSEGTVGTDFGDGSTAHALVRQPDGHLVVAGGSGIGGSNVVLARYAPDGRLDATFGKGGTVTTDLGAVEWANALVQQPDGKLIVAGTAIDPTRSLSSSLLLRYQPDGRLDPAFGIDGVVTTAFTGNALVLQPDGKLVAAGGASSPDGGDLALARYQTAGCADRDRACREALEQFVTGFYVEALARTPRAAQVADWVAYLEAEPTVAATSAMIHAFFDGAEYRARPVTPWDHVTALYRAILGRAPDPAGLDWWVGVLLDRLNTTLPLFLESPEFHRLVPDCREGSPMAALVTHLYEEALGRTPTLDEVTAWTQYLLATCDLDGVVVAFFNTAEYLRVPRTLADHVTSLYQALLVREPAEAEETFWVTYLAGQLALLEEGFIQSAEFQARWQQLFLSSSR